MRNKNLFFLLVFLFLFSVFSQELTITTYYPSPVGIYKELKSNKLGVGPNTDPATLTDGELEVEGKLTVGGNSLIDGNLSVEGNSIVKRNLIIGGKVGIGTTNPDGKLQVVGDGVVVGNPTGGNKGAGTINVEKIYVNGSEIGVQVCGWFEGECPEGWVNEPSPATKTKKESVYYNFLGYIATYYLSCACCNTGGYGCAKVKKTGGLGILCHCFDAVYRAHTGGGECCEYQYGAEAAVLHDTASCIVGEGEAIGKIYKCNEYKRDFLWCCPPKE